MIGHIYKCRNGKTVRIIKETPLAFLAEVKEEENNVRYLNKTLLNDKEDTGYDLMECLSGKDKRRG